MATRFTDVVSVGGRAMLGTLFGLATLDSVDNALFTVLAPDIRASLGISSAAVAIIGAIAGVMVTFVGLPLGWLGDRRRRTTIAGVCTLLWAVSAALLGLVQSLWQLVAVRVLAGIGKANEGPIQTAILVDAYPPAGRGRALAVQRSGLPVGIMVGPLLAALFAVVTPPGQASWRWAFGVLAAVGVVLALVMLRLPEPRRAAVVQVPLRAAFARLRGIRTFSAVMAALGAFGMCVTTVPIYLSFILEDNLGQDDGARGIIGAVSALGALSGAAVGGIYGDRLFRRSPSACLYLAAGGLVALGVSFGLQAYAPNVVAFLLIGMVCQAALYAGLVLLSLVVAAVTPPDFRATAFALVGLYLALVGGLGGALVAGLASTFWSARTTVAVVAPLAALVAGVILARGAVHLPGDLERNHE